MPYLPPRARTRTPARLDALTGRLVFLDPRPVDPARLPLLDPEPEPTDTTRTDHDR